MHQGKVTILLGVEFIGDLSRNARKHLTLCFKIIMSCMKIVVTFCWNYLQCCVCVFTIVEGIWRSDLSWESWHSLCWPWRSATDAATVGPRFSIETWNQQTSSSTSNRMWSLVTLVLRGSWIMTPVLQRPLLEHPTTCLQWGFNCNVSACFLGIFGWFKLAIGNSDLNFNYCPMNI